MLYDFQDIYADQDVEEPSVADIYIRNDSDDSDYNEDDLQMIEKLDEHAYAHGPVVIPRVC